MQDNKGDSRRAWSPGRSGPGDSRGQGRRLGANAYVSAMMLDSRRPAFRREDHQSVSSWKSNKEAPSGGLLTALAIPSMRRAWMKKIAKWFGAGRD